MGRGQRKGRKEGGKGALDGIVKEKGRKRETSIGNHEHNVRKALGAD